MTEDFKGKVAIITGAGGGIGCATALAFAKEGVKVVVVDVNEAASIYTHESIKEINGTSMPIVADISNNDDCIRIIDETISAFGRLDILFNNAGITVRENSLNTSVEAWRKVIDVNLTGVFLLSKCALVPMTAQKSGCIINTASGWGINGGARAVSYCASKGGVVLLTKAMAIDHGADGIRVNCICPGDTNTGMLVDEAIQLGLAEDQLIKEGASRPLGRVGQPEDIANAVLFLASEKSGFITGTPLIVDGGGLAGSA
ncbi:SDR family NAD(P)-dependent oxidoreductase [Teredinibacter franksiae]|jgi:Dehydrogenases with different specificities (related to short-chain alcohol dehydrogenases)|uniref:SDR family NAD(P)-dependent oxidoreductase n=1 Tax=Teredinibacter franksiae TaxID=2761453 RepID=UPI0016252417|nr:glucose 1-dehydrogenase [Teredinibacter franksiae]